MSNSELLNTAIAEYNSESAKYAIKPSKVSGTRVRNLLMSVNKLTKEVRKDILTAQKAVPKKPRVKKDVVEVVQEVQEIVQPEVKVKKTKKAKST